MAITVSHQPDFAMLARAGYRVGAGEAMQHYQDQAHQAAMQERALQANSMNQQVAHINSLQRMQYGAQLAGQQRMEDFAQNAMLSQQRAAAERDIRKMQMDSARDNLVTNFNLQKQNKLLDASTSQERDINQFLLKQSGSHLEQVEELLGDGLQFEDGGTKYAAVKKEMDRIWDEDTLTPTAKAQAIYQLSQQIPIPTVKPKTPQERVDEDVIERTVTMPDGTQIKTLWSEEPDGTMRMHGEFAPEKPKEEKGSIPEQALQDIDNFMKVRAQALRELQSQTDAEGEKKLNWTEEEIEKRMLEIIRSSAEPGRESMAPQPARGPVRMRFENGTWQQVS